MSIQNDLSDAHLQIFSWPKKLLTISTHEGLYQSNRYSPEVKTALRIVDSMVADLEDPSVYLDDSIVTSDALEEHKPD